MSIAGGKSHEKRIPSGGRLVVLVVDRDRFQVFGFKDMVAIQTAEIIYAVASRQDFSTRMRTGLHKKRIDLLYASGIACQAPLVLG